MKTTTQPFNPFAYCETQEEINEILLECYQDDDPSVFVAALGHLAKHHGMTDVAKAAGLNRESLYKTFDGKTQPRYDTIHRLMKALGVSFSVAA